MKAANPFRWEGGVAGIATGVHLVAGHPFSLGGDPIFGAVSGPDLTVVGAAPTGGGFARLGCSLLPGA